MKYSIKPLIFSIAIFMLSVYVCRLIFNIESPLSDIVNIILAISAIVITHLIWKLRLSYKNNETNYLKITIAHLTGKKPNELSYQEQEMVIGLFENLDNGLAITDADKNLIYVNPALCRIVGIPKEELLNKNIAIYTDIVKGKNKEKLLSYLLSEPNKANHQKYEVEILRPDGSAANVLISSIAIVDDSGKSYGSLETLTDITDLINREHNIKLSEEKFRSIVKYLSEFLWVVDTNAVVKFEAPSVSRILGYKQDYFIGKNSLEFIHPDDREIAINEFNIIITNERECQPIAFRVQHADGNWIWLETLGNNMMDIPGVEGIIVTSRDITKRLESETEIHELHRIISHSPAVAFIWNKGTKDPVKYVSENCYQLTGYTREEFLSGKVIYSSIVHPDDILQVRHEVDSSSDDKTLSKINHNPYRIITKDDAIVWVSDSTEINRDENGAVKCYHGIVVDITERMQAIIALKESENRYKALIETSPIPTVVHSGGIVVYVNSSAIKVMDGSSMVDFLGKSILDFVHPDYKDIARKRALDAYQNRKSSELLEEKFITLSGRVIDVEVIGSIIEYQNKQAALLAFQDITDSKQAKEELRNSEKQYHELFNSVLEGVCLADKDVFVEFCNPAMAEIFEEKDVYTIVGKNLIDYCQMEYLDKVEKEIKKHHAGESSQFELGIESALGNIKILLTSVMPRFSNEGVFIGTFISVMDITEIKHLQELANRAQRLEAAGRIAGQVAHDFNNLLAPLMAYPEFIKSDLPENHPAIQYLDDIEYAAEQMAEINQQLLTLGRRGHYRLEIVNLNDIIRQTANQIRPIPESLNLVLDLDERIMPIKGSVSQIYRVILNIVTNARDTMYDIGTLTIKTENTIIKKLSGKFGSVPPGKYVKMTISDTGSGIPTDIIPKILDPFFTTKAPGTRKGSGLGLSIVHNVIEDHKGYLDLNSVPGRGTDFYIYFPVTLEQIDSDTQKQIIGGTEKILVVDDDAMQRTVSVKILTRLGYKASEVGNGEEAIEFVKEYPQDLILLNMAITGDMDGLETYKQLTKMYPSQKVIIVSGHAQSNRVKNLLNRGAISFMRKPLTYNSLALTVRIELDKKTSKTKQVEKAV